jgi:opacity protein-like surface antigen
MKIQLVALALVAAASSVQAQDWSGFYLGLNAGRATGEMQYFVNNGTPDTVEDIGGSYFGLFGGYTVQQGALVWGGELALSSGDADYAQGYGFTDFIDLKGRVGYATGPVLVYGTLGWTVGDWEEEGFPALRSDGPVYGFGIDYQVGERMFVGGEYLRRDIESENFPVPISGTNVTGDFGTLSLRLGLRF